MSSSWNIWPRDPRKYASVRPSADSTEDEGAPFVSNSSIEKLRFTQSSGPQALLNILVAFPWVLSFILSLLSLFMVLHDKTDVCHLPNSFDRGWTTDFGQ